MELRNACQCCLLRPLDKDLKKCYRRLDQKEVYSDMLEECFEIQLWSSGLEVEAGICEICVSRLRDACDFKRQVVRCQRKLQAAVKEEGEDDDKDEVVVVMVDSDIEFLDDDIKSESPDSPEPCSSPDYLEDSKPESKVNPAGIPRTTGVTVKRTLEKRRRSSADDSVKDEDVKRKPLSQEKSDLAKLLGLPKSDITVRPTRAEGPKTRAQRAIAKTPTTTQKPVPLRINLPAAKKPVKVTPKPTPKTPPKSKSADEVKVRKRKSAAALAAVKAHEANVRTLIQHSNCTPFLTRTIAGIQCCYCQENFFNLALLREHMQLAHSNDEYRGMDAAKHRNNTSCKMDTTDLKCTLCEQNFDLLSSLKEHLIMEHDVKFTPEESNYIIEFKLSNEGEVMNCALCNYKCEAFKTLLIHMNRHCRNFICEECDIGFVNEHRLRMHKKTHRIGNFECSFCPKVFLTAVALERHENCSHKNPNVIRRRKCPLCEKTFPSYYVRNRHILDDHNSSAAAYKCSICNQIFVLKMHLSNHIRKVHLMERNHKCSECEMSFFSRKSLNRHMVRHNGERIYKCTVCNKAYARIFTLKEHMRIHNNDRRFKCELCGSTFIQKCTLKSHMLSNHDVVLAEFEQNKRS